ncbi:glycosyltransferase [Marinitoga sp. 38H-ov]|uniref:glycosyltransferase family 2 protein n=1 Tax=Marinitoga sp. 38H-ov TaxID=1755814 RepID=UPI0013EDAC8C|nr:glycosyltransferase [Marinitoga sp. 38H-ov]KAF2955601.1 hypothetical protein AS160_09525 [Marinitoga sp. 38H-ov]
MTLSFLLMTNDRLEELKEALDSIYETITLNKKYDYEIVILLNGSKEEYQSQIRNFISEKMDKIKHNIIYSKKNVGVAEGRNILFKNSKADVLIFLDDDAEIINKKSFIGNIFSIKNKNPKIGIISVKSLGMGGNIRNKEIPLTKLNKNGNKSFFTYHFVGVGHIIFREAVKNEKELYPSNLFYGMEEYYLSYKVINNGFKIYYSNDLIVLHKKSDKTRLKPIEYYIHLASNKIFIGSLLGDTKLLISHFILWNIWGILKCKNFICLIKIIKRFNQLNYSKEKYKIELSKGAKKYIKNVGGKYWY